MTLGFKPMLFSTPMVVAIDNGSKTMTRRTQGLELVNDDEVREWVFSGFGKNIKERDCAVFSALGYGDTWAEVPLKIVKGDVIWVRETFGKSWHHKQPRFFYRAIDGEIGNHPDFGGWKPSIHMPKEACRQWLKVKDVRVERLNDIREEDAKAEGVDNWTWKNMAKPQNWKNYLDPKSPPLFSAYDSFVTLWMSVNGEESWDKNPWVWVYDFEKIDKPEGW